jgi:hypothetical protein
LKPRFSGELALSQKSRIERSETFHPSPDFDGSIAFVSGVQAHAN